MKLSSKKTISAWLTKTALGVAMGASTLVSAPGFAEDRRIDQPSVQNVERNGDGTSVGGGGVTAREQYLAYLDSKLGPKIKIPGTTPDLGLTVARWCSRVGELLKTEQKRAYNQRKAGHNEQAKQTLIDAMVKAAQSIEFGSEVASPLTKILLDRGLRLSQTLDDLRSMSPEDKQKLLMTQTRFLFKYISFVVRTQTELDVPYHLTYIYRYDSCGWGKRPVCPAGFDRGTYENRFLVFAHDLLAFAYETSTETSNNPSLRTQTVAVGDPRVFLKSAEYVASWVAEDISKTIFAAKEACVAQQLSTLSQALTLFDTGDRSIYLDEVEAVAGASQDLVKFAARIYEPHTCYDDTPPFTELQ